MCLSLETDLGFETVLNLEKGIGFKRNSWFKSNFGLGCYKNGELTCASYLIAAAINVAVFSMLIPCLMISSHSLFR